MKKFFFYICAFILCWIYSVNTSTVDWDLWARMAVGKIFLQVGHVLNNDIFSFTPTKDIWIDHEWGSGVIFYLLAHHFGDTGILLAKIIGNFLIIYIISKTIELQNKKPDSHLNFIFYFFVIAGMFMATGATIRCQLFTFIFLALWIYILERVRRGETRLLWIMPVTIIIWANLHGGFVVGLGLLGIYGVGEFLNRNPWKKYFLMLIPTTFVTLINPYGFKYWEYILQATTMSRYTISEWRPVDLFGPLGNWFGFKVFLIITVFSIIFKFAFHKFNFKEFDKVKFILLIVTAYFAIRHNKHIALYVITAASFLYYDFYLIFSWIRDLTVAQFGEKADKVLKAIIPRKDAIIYCFVIVAGCFIIFTMPFYTSVNINKYPIGSVEFIKQNKLSGNLLTLFHWGSYAVWRLYPQCLIAEDGRYEEVYPDKIHLKVYDFNYKTTSLWKNFLKEYHTDIIMMEKVNDSYPAMLEDKEWKEVYADIVSAVFVPANKVKKSYKQPSFPDIIKAATDKKYETAIDFLD